MSPSADVSVNGQTNKRATRHTMGNLEIIEEFRGILYLTSDIFFVIPGMLSQWCVGLVTQHASLSYCLYWELFFFFNVATGNKIVQSFSSYIGLGSK